MAILHDIHKNNVVFVEDSVCKNKDFKVSNINDGTDISKVDETCFSVKLLNENVHINSVYQIFYNKNANEIVLFTKDYAMSITKDLMMNEIVDIEYNYEENCIFLEICELPKFLSENRFSDTYPKFEVNVSDCVYSMKIFTSNSEYIDIPQYQSHYTMSETLKHISEVIFYMTHEDPSFVDKLDDYNKMEIIVNEKDTTKSGIYNYKLSESGICLFGKEFEGGFYVVEWQKFFRLVVDRTWEVEFVE